MAIDKIGKYQIRAELGRGGMATVYEAWDPTFERKIALKVLPDALLHDGTFRQRFEREAKTIAALEHPAIVPVYDYGEADSKVFLAMRYMGGGSLADTLRAGPMAAPAIARIYERVAPALDLAHGKGVTHRDLKPGNILFDDNGEPYVSDFGIAKLALASNTELTHGGVIGTPSYMSPEQARGERLDGRSDVYAMGVMLFQMLAGRLPFQSETPTGLMMKHILDPIPRLATLAPGLPGAWQAVIDRAMAKNPADRYANMASLANDLRAIADGRSMTATPPMESPNPILQAGPPATLVYDAPAYAQAPIPATSVMSAPPVAHGTPAQPMSPGTLAMAMPASAAPPPAQAPRRSASPLLIILGVLGAIMLCGGAVAVLAASGVFGGASPAAPAATIAAIAPSRAAVSAPAATPTTAVIVLPSITPIPVASTATSAPSTPTPAPTSTPAPTATRGPTAAPIATTGPSCATGTAAITSPASGQALKGKVAVTGSAGCVDFEYYKFEFVDTRCGATGLCFVAGKFLKPVVNGELMTWDTTRTFDGAKLPNGTYVLRLTVVGVGRPGYANVLPNQPQITVVIKN